MESKLLSNSYETPNSIQSRVGYNDTLSLWTPITLGCNSLHNPLIANISSSGVELLDNVVLAPKQSFDPLIEVVKDLLVIPQK